MSVNFSDDWNQMVSQIKSGISGPSDQTLQKLLDEAFGDAGDLSAQQLQILIYAEDKSNNWTSTSGMRVSNLEDFGLSEGTANALIAITGQLTILTSEAQNIRQTTFNNSISDYKELEEAFGSADLSWYYNAVADAIISGDPGFIQSQKEFLSIITPYRPPRIVEVTDKDLLSLPFPNNATLNLYRNNVFSIQQDIPYYNDDNNEEKIWKALPAPDFASNVKLTDVLIELQFLTGTPMYDADFIAGVNLMKQKADQVNSYAALKGRDYDDLRWMYDGPEQTISLFYANGHQEIQKAILKKFSEVARDTTITTYSGIEAQLQTSVIPGLELNFSAALTTLCMFAKINLQSPGFITADQARTYLVNTYKIANNPDFIFTGLGIELQDLVEMPIQALSLTDFQLTPEINLTRAEIIALAGIGVSLLTGFIVYGQKAKDIETAFEAVKTIVVDTAITTVVLTVLVETALIYSKTGSVGGTIAQILADGVILFVDVLEDLFKDLWNALKGEWAKFIAVIGSAAGIIAGGEAIIGTDLIAGSSEIAAGEATEGAEVAAGEVAEGAEQEAGDVVEGFENIF